MNTKERFVMRKGGLVKAIAVSTVALLSLKLSTVNAEAISVEENVQAYVAEQIAAEMKRRALTGEFSSKNAILEYLSTHVSKNDASESDSNFEDDKILNEQYVDSLEVEKPKTVENSLTNPVTAENFDEIFGSHINGEYVSEELSDVLEDAVISLTEDEYYEICFMCMHESGDCSWAMNNGCASTVVNRCISRGLSVTSILRERNQYCNGVYKRRFYNNDGSYVYREIRRSDVTAKVYDAVNMAIRGYDVNELKIGKSIGFWAPNYCSKETQNYFWSHIRGYTYIENVCFFHEWI